MMTVATHGVEDKSLDAFRRGLGIGSGAGFDEAAAPHQHQYVVITGRVNDICRGFWTACTDRAPDLEPISIRLAIPPKEQD
jgi:hypothetical protein